MNVDEIIKTINIEAIRARYPQSDEAHRSKYLDLRTYIKQNLQRLRVLGLDTGPPRRVLDLGCGCGYFVFLCRLAGHDAIGIDRKERRSLYTDMRELLGVPWVPHAIRAFEPLPSLGRFDVVTAHMICFNGHRVKPWGVAEWEWLLGEVSAPVIHLEFNAEPEGTLFPPGVRDLFLERGARIDEHRVLIDRH